VTFDAGTGLATFRTEIAYEKKHFSSTTHDPPTAEFKDPAEVASALEELVRIFRHYYGPVHLVYCFKKPAGVLGSEHEQWLFNLCASRMELLRVELEELGVPGELLTTSLEHSSDPNAATHHFEFDVRAEVRQLRVFSDRIECHANVSELALDAKSQGCAQGRDGRSIRLVDDGFAVGFADGGALAVQVLLDDPLEPWIDALKVLSMRCSDEAP